jgi:hypothetical protein
MCVPVAEAGHEAATGEIELGCASRRVVERFVVERHDHAVLDRDGPRDGARHVSGEHRAVAEQQRSAHGARNLRRRPARGKGIRLRV